jgi:hypothetical protein
MRFMGSLDLVARNLRSLNYTPAKSKTPPRDWRCLPSQHQEAHPATRLAEKSRRLVESGDGFSLRAHTAATCEETVSGRASFRRDGLMNEAGSEVS